MRRSEFDDEVRSLSDLFDLCIEVDCPVLNEAGLMDEDYRDEILCDEAVERARNDTWDQLRDWLCDIPTGYAYYMRDDWGDWIGYGENEYHDFVEDVMEWMDNNDAWDPEEEEEGVEEEAYDADPEEPEEECDFEYDDALCLDDLVADSVSIVTSAFQVLKSERAEEDKQFEMLVF